MAGALLVVTICHCFGVFAPSHSPFLCTLHRTRRPDTYTASVFVFPTFYGRTVHLKTPADLKPPFIDLQSMLIFFSEFINTDLSLRNFQYNTKIILTTKVHQTADQLCLCTRYNVITFQKEFVHLYKAVIRTMTRPINPSLTTLQASLTYLNLYLSMF